MFAGIPSHSLINISYITKSIVEITIDHKITVLVKKLFQKSGVQTLKNYVAEEPADPYASTESKQRFLAANIARSKHIVTSSKNPIARAVFRETVGALEERLNELMKNSGSATRVSKSSTSKPSPVLPAELKVDGTDVCPPNPTLRC